MKAGGKHRGIEGRWPKADATGTAIRTWLTSDRSCCDWQAYFRSCLSGSAKPGAIREVQFYWASASPHRVKRKRLGWGEYLDKDGVTGVEQIKRVSGPFLWFDEGWETINKRPTPRWLPGDIVDEQWTFRLWCADETMYRVIPKIQRIIKASSANAYTGWWVPVLCVDGIVNPEFRWWLKWRTK